MTMNDSDPAHRVAGKYGIEDLVDLDVLARLFKKFSAATGFTTGLLSYPSQKILLKTGWRDACVKFHRADPTSIQVCHASNVELSRHLKKHRELSICQCRWGLVDGATPIIVRGVYLAYLATGQVFFQPPDLDHYRKIARQFGFDTTKYLQAIQAVPVVSKARFRMGLVFLSELATLIAEQGLLRLENQEQNAQLRKREKQFRDLFESSRDAIMTVAPPAWRYTSGNPATVKMFRAKNEAEFVAHTPWELSPGRQPDGRASSEKARAMIAMALRNGSHFFEWTHRRLTGAEFQADVLLTKMKPNGNVVVQATVRDITESKRAAQALRTSEERYRALVAHIPDVTWTSDRKGQTTYISPNIKAVYGYSPEQIYRQGTRLWWGRIHPNDCARVKQAYANLFRRQERFDVEYRIQRQDGQWIWLHDRATQTYEKDRRTLADGVFTDITKRKQLEAEIQHVSETEKQRLGQDLHDGLGQQLTALRILASALKTSLVRKSLPAAEKLDVIVSGLAHASAQTRDLAQGLFPVELKNGGIVFALQKLAATVANLSKISCRVIAPREIHFADLNVARQLFRIAQEATNNAVKHSHSQHIWIQLVKQKGRIILTVKDDGVGFSKKNLERTGMGLRIMQYRAGILNTNLTIARAPGRGTLVTCSVASPAANRAPECPS